MHRTIRIAAVCALLCALWGDTGASAAKLTPIGKFTQPIFVTSDPVNADRLLIAERQGGVTEVGPGGTKQLLDIHELVSCCESERGLLSLAPAPDFGSTGRFYVAYTGTPAAGGSEGDVHVDSFHPGPDGQMVRDQILVVGHSQNPNHNGGQLQFGPDGYLYISSGDGGGGGDPDGNGQSTETLLGKILRIDPRPGETPTYTIPPGNPFAAGAGADEVWAYGLRNPWRFSFDRATGDLVIADVGQDTREELDFAPSGAGGAVGGGGANYGWNCREGFIPYPGAPGGCPSGGFNEPVFDYPHDDPGGGGLHGCSIIGGYVVRDQSLADLYGRYLYTDYCNEEIRSLALPASASGQASGDRSEGMAVESPTSFGEDACGRIYVASGLGSVYRIEGTASAVCPPPELLAVRKHPRAGVRLRVKHNGAWVRLTARVVPCAGHARAKLQLNRGGKRLRVKRLDRKCVARFQLRVQRRSTFRALFLADTAIRSRRLTVRPPHAKPGG